MSDRPVFPLTGRWPSALGVLLLVAVTASIWWRNHDILSDLYDYSSVIAAAGKLESGLKPYVDFRSTMQSSTYLLSRAVEVLCGRGYLELTRGGLAFAVMGAVLTFALWRRSFGVAGGLALAAAVAWSGLSQHVVIFYNTIGILCLALVVMGVAQSPSLWPSTSRDRMVVIGALVLGGINKLNFQCLAVALSAVLVVDAGLSGRIGWRDAVRSGGVLLGAGLVLPLALELGWTGASPQLWFENVVQLADARVQAWTKLGEPGVYLGPAYDLHHHIPFKWLTGAGLVLLMVVAGVVLHGCWRGPGTLQRKLGRTHVVGVYVLGAAVGGVLLTVTNVETIALTSLAFLIGAAALWVGTMGPEPPRTGPGARLGWLLPVAGLFWAVNGGWAAWNGSRVLFAREHRERNTFVRLENAPAALGYMEGVRFDAFLHETLLSVDRELQRLQTRRPDLSGVLFGPGYEWLERSFPEATMPGMPVWYDVGTVLREDDGAWLRGRLESRGVDRILAHPAWESWPVGFRDTLRKEYRAVPVGRLATLYERKGTEDAPVAAESFAAGEPLAVIERTGSNFHRFGLAVPADCTIAASPWGDILGRSGTWQWHWPRGPVIAEGTIVARRLQPVDRPVRFEVVATATGADGRETVLWEKVATLPAGQRNLRLPKFRLTPYGDAVRWRLSVEPQQGESLFVGFRELRVTQTQEKAEVRPPPPTVVAADGHWLDLTDGTRIWRRVATAAGSRPAPGQAAAFEAWTWRESGDTPWRVVLEAESGADGAGTPAVVMLMWYRAGRIELLRQEALEAQHSGEVVFEGWMPEPGGWLGVAVRPLEQGKRLASRIHVRGWSY